MDATTALDLLRQAETDLAFALAQGDGLAEDGAAERIAQIKALLADACSCGGINAVTHATDHASDCTIWR